MANQSDSMETQVRGKFEVSSGHRTRPIRGSISYAFADGVCYDSHNNTTHDALLLLKLNSIYSVNTTINIILIMSPTVLASLVCYRGPHVLDTVSMIS